MRDMQGHHFLAPTGSCQGFASWLPVVGITHTDPGMRGTTMRAASVTDLLGCIVSLTIIRASITPLTTS
jgi:hypothetical protein